MSLNKGKKRKSRGQDHVEATHPANEKQKIVQKRREQVQVDVDVVDEDGRRRRGRREEEHR